MKPDIILQVTVKLLLPFILVFALYVQFHGDYGPGGGFQAGVISAAMVILYSIIFGLPAAQRVVRPRLAELMIPTGVLIFAGTGVVTMLLGDNYLAYYALMEHRQHAQEWGVLIVEIGVLLTVAGTMISIFFAFSGRGR
jgi:multicomponent Na+:H+ antiporter subunit B